MEIILLLIALGVVIALALGGIFAFMVLYFMVYIPEHFIFNRVFRYLDEMGKEDPVGATSINILLFIVPIIAYIILAICLASWVLAIPLVSGHCTAYLEKR